MTLLALPPDMLHEVLTHLSPRELVALGCTSRYCFAMCAQELARFRCHPSDVEGERRPERFAETVVSGDNLLGAALRRCPPGMAVLVTDGVHYCENNPFQGVRSSRVFGSQSDGGFIYVDCFRDLVLRGDNLLVNLSHMHNVRVISGTTQVRHCGIDRLYANDSAVNLHDSTIICKIDAIRATVNMRGGSFGGVVGHGFHAKIKSSHCAIVNVDANVELCTLAPIRAKCDDSSSLTIHDAQCPTLYRVHDAHTLWDGCACAACSHKKHMKNTSCRPLISRLMARVWNASRSALASFCATIIRDFYKGATT